MTKSVVCAGEVHPEPAADFVPKLPLEETALSKLVVEGKPVLAAASTTFTNSKAGVTEPVMWNTGSTKLTVSDKGVLLSGANAVPPANRLVASTPHKLLAL
ncbi:hypothetical protein [Azospirillum sp.]|uniref:hypothetical protein n=1 Tax=Azospirillum sp. TaxID=34012 RepID=UPI002D43603D|nr:hypothetical protein [Azospirillum sp.]HYF90106.1 hypothetical protein [Azospirillum sp.]